MSATPASLAKKIIDRLVKEGLVRREDRTSLLAKFETGSLTSEDWRLALELALGKEAGE